MAPFHDATRDRVVLPSPDATSYSLSSLASNLAPHKMQSSHRLNTRATTTYTPCAGCANPANVNNKAFFALFAILGVAMVATIIWFFFHAKNGGFHFQEGDWDDYKSTVLRRKGPDGKTLSNATKSTKLGGGSIVDRDRLAALSIVGYDEKGRLGVRAKRGFGGSHSIYYSDNFTDYTGSRADERTETATQPDRHNHTNNEKRAEEGRHHAQRYRDRDVHHYRKEAPARVGGMNRPADGVSSHDFSDTATQITDSTDRSTVNLIRKDPNAEEREERKRARAERKAREDARLMERKWRKEAEAAARAIAREGDPAPVAVPLQQVPRRERREASSGTLKKRDYSFSRGQDEVSTAPSGSGTGSASYYDEYRPKNDKRKASGNRQGESAKGGYRRYAESENATSDSGTRVYEHKISKAPVKEKKKESGGRDVMAGYRRGRGGDSEDDL